MLLFCVLILKIDSDEDRAPFAISMMENSTNFKSETKIVVSDSKSFLVKMKSDRFSYD